MDSTPIPMATPTLPYNPESDATPVLNFDFDTATHGTHIYIVQGYNVANHGGIIDYAWVFLILALVVFGIFLITKSLKNV